MSLLGLNIHIFAINWIIFSTFQQHFNRFLIFFSLHDKILKTAHFNQISCEWFQWNALCHTLKVFICLCSNKFYLKWKKKPKMCFIQSTNLQMISQSLITITTKFQLLMRRDMHKDCFDWCFASIENLKFKTCSQSLTVAYERKKNQIK